MQFLFRHWINTFVLIETWINKNSSTRLMENNDDYQSSKSMKNKMKGLKREKKSIRRFDIKNKWRYDHDNDNVKDEYETVNNNNNQSNAFPSRRTKIVLMQEIECSTEIVTQINCCFFLQVFFGSVLGTGQRSSYPSTIFSLCCLIFFFFIFQLNCLR